MRLGPLLAALAMASIEASAAAQPSPHEARRSMPARVVLRRSACTTPSIDEASYVRLLGIELATDGVTEVEVVGAGDVAPVRASGPALAVLSMEGGCDGAVLTFEIDDAATDKKVRRIIDLRDLPEAARARALSLATAELLRASWAELVLPGAPRPRAPVPPSIRESTADRLANAPPVATVRPPGRMPVRPSVFVSAVIDGRYFFDGGVGLLGGRLAASIPVIGPLRIRADAGAAYGRATDPLGQIDLWLVTAAIGAGVGSTWEAATFEIGPRVELGWGFTRGIPGAPGITGHAGSALVAIGTVAATGRLRLGSRWWAALELEAGPVLHGFSARAGARDASGFGGAMGGGRFGVAAAL